MAIVGYARVSTVGQNLSVQIDKLKTAGCEKIYKEKKSGVDQSRPELKQALDYVREGDTFVIARIDRLARSVSHLSHIVDELRNKGVDLIIVDQNIDTTTAAGKAMLQMLGIFAEFENSIRFERQQDGIARAKREDSEKGVNRFGRPIKATPKLESIVRDLHQRSVPMYEIESATGLSRATCYRVLKKQQHD